MQLEIQEIQKDMEQGKYNISIKQPTVIAEDGPVE